MSTVPTSTGDGRERNRHTEQRHARRLSTETKASFKTTEFLPSSPSWPES